MEIFMNRQLRLLCLAFTPLILAACGSDSSSSSTTTAPPAVAPATVNVALPANGASVSATYGSGSTDNFVNDGDSANTTNFWAANVTGDKATIDFGRLRNVSEITVYTNDTSYSSGTPTKDIEISADNATWKKTALPLGGDITCPTYSAGSGKIRCVFATTQSIRYFHVVITSATPSTQHIIEMEAVGN
jgi:hypothetical protein